MGRPPPLGARGLVLLALLAAGAWAVARLGIGDLAVGRAGLAEAGRFFSRALSPAIISEAPPPFGGRSILPDVFEGARLTVVFAAAAVGLAWVAGLLLAFLGATAWWRGDLAGSPSLAARIARRAAAPALYGATRALIALLRSVHEFLWAILFLCAMGRSNATAVLAIAIPYTGTFAKVFSEMIDEAPRGPALALRASGARPVHVFLFGLLPQALPDILAYTFYRFECGLRSSAVLGFFGYPTLGYFLSASFENLYYGEVWTYLYALVALVLAMEWWSGALRKRFVA